MQADVAQCRVERGEVKARERQQVFFQPGLGSAEDSAGFREVVDVRRLFFRLWHFYLSSFRAQLWRQAVEVGGNGS